MPTKKPVYRTFRLNRFKNTFFFKSRVNTHRSYIKSYNVHVYNLLISTSLYNIVLIDTSDTNNLYRYKVTYSVYFINFMIIFNK